MTPRPAGPAGHVALVVVDDPAVCAAVAAALRARGDAVLLAGTVEEALAILASKRFCYAVVDQQLPWQAGEQAFVSGGEHVTSQIRAASSRRSESRYALPIVAMTRCLVDSDADRDRIADFIAKVHELGANAFVEKPLDAKNMEKLLGCGEAGGARREAAEGTGMTARGRASRWVDGPS